MKKRHFASKLSLRKQTIVTLDAIQQGAIRGGQTENGCESNIDPCLSDPVTVCDCATNPQASCLPYC